MLDGDPATAGAARRAHGLGSRGAPPSPRPPPRPPSLDPSGAAAAAAAGGGTDGATVVAVGTGAAGSASDELALRAHHGAVPRR